MGLELSIEPSKRPTSTLPSDLSLHPSSSKTDEFSVEITLEPSNVIYIEPPKHSFRELFLEPTVEPMLGSSPEPSSQSSYDSSFHLIHGIMVACVFIICMCFYNLFY